MICHIETYNPKTDRYDYCPHQPRYLREFRDNHGQMIARINLCESHKDVKITLNNDNTPVLKK